MDIATKLKCNQTFEKSCLDIDGVDQVRYELTEKNSVDHISDLLLKQYEI